MFDYTPEIPQTKEIPLTQGKVAIVDAADYEWLSQFSWSLYKAKRSNTFYAQRGISTNDGKSHTMFMHREILGAKRGLKVDHKDGNGLNNTRDNLRAATHAENMQNSAKHTNNTSGYKGVTWHRGDRKWQAQISANGKRKYLGSFNVVVDAARAYDAAAKELHGKFARLNFG